MIPTPETFNGLPEVPALQELKTKRQWVAWRFKERNGRTTKPPVNPHTGGGASHSDPATWGTYDQAATHAASHGLPGVGFVLSEGDDFTGIDLDKCIRPDGSLEPWAEYVTMLAETYTEVSPSGRGLRLISRGKVDQTVKCDPAHVEIYRGLRYLTITGRQHPCSPGEIRPAPLTLDALMEHIKASAPDITPGQAAPATASRTDFVGRTGHAALERLGEWVPELFPTATFHKATGAYRVTSEDLGRELEEDLSIAPTGIIDFGLHDMGDPRNGKRTAVDIVLEYGDLPEGATEIDAAFWLCDKLGTAPEALGHSTAAAEFGALDELDIGEPPRPANKQDDFLEPEKKADIGFPITRASTALTSTLPPRQWLYGYMLSRKYVGILASPGGVGKTAYTFAATLAMASGEAHLHDRPHKPLRVWLYNLEDDITELERRIQALARHYDVKPETLDNIILTSGRDRPLQLVTQKDGKTIATNDAKHLADALLANNVDVLILDPLVNAHAIPENDNEAAAKLMRVVAKIADMANCAILLVHHTRKGFVAGEADSIRGGSPLVANSRGAYTLAPMSTEEAKLYGVPEDMRKRYVKLDDAKANMSVSSGRARWMHLQSVALGNGDAEYPTGDSVQVVVKWSPPQALDGMEQSDIRTMLEAVEAGAGDGERFSIRTQDKDRWAGQILVDEFGKTPEQAKAFLKTASENGWITTEEYTSPTQRKVRKGLFVHLAKLPEEAIAEIE